MATQVDLSAILAKPTFAPQPGAPAPQAVAAPAKQKKKSPTADQKREKIVLDMLSGKDTFGLEYGKLLLQLSPQEVDEYVVYVRAKNGLQ